MIDEANLLLTTTEPPEGRSKRACEPLGTAFDLADHLLKESPAVTLGKLGDQEVTLRGSDGLRILPGFTGNSVEIVSELSEVENIAIGKSIRELPRLRKFYGTGRWFKRKGLATVKLPNGTLRTAELHWYEASGIGKKEFKIKRFTDRQ